MREVKGDEQGMMTQLMARAIAKFAIFYSYADEDKEWQVEVQKRLKPGLRLVDDVDIVELHREGVPAGAVWEEKVEQYLKEAQVILLLLSADYLAPDERNHSLEVQRILELYLNKTDTSQAKGSKAPHIIPILVRPLNWKITPFAKLQILPRNGKAISVWDNREEALELVVKDIDKVIRGLTSPTDAIQTNSAHEVVRLRAPAPLPKNPFFSPDFEGFPPLSNNTQIVPVEEAVQTYKSELPPQNPFFTGREDLLDQLRRKFMLPKTTARLTNRQAIRGLGGIGKTELAIEYVHRFREFYNSYIWINAENRETLIDQYFKIAQGLRLQERNVEAVMHWLEPKADWLLILDNANDLKMVQEFIPTTTNGHLLLTTNARALGKIAEPSEIECMGPEEGTLFLLRRAKKISTNGSTREALPTDQKNAKEIVQELGGLPLALDQAGAYIEETGEELGQYLQLYRSQGVQLLQKRSELDEAPPPSVITTFWLAFQKVEQANPVAANVLRLCAFLAPDDIPESLLIDHFPTLIIETTSPPISQPQEQKALKSPFSLFRQLRAKPQAPAPINNRIMLNEASKALLRFSLIHRDDRNATIAVHRLVQAVLRNKMDENTQRRWAEYAVLMVNAAFPNVELHKVDVKTWPDCEKLLPQVFACAPLIKKYQFIHPEASRLLNDAATYLTERAQYQEAEPLYQQALGIRKVDGGLLYAQSLHNLAKVYERLAHYSKAERNLREALKIREQALGENHADVVLSLNSLAELYVLQGKYDQAEPLYERALNINQNNFEPGHPSTSQTFNNLATLYLKQEKYEKAEKLYKTALEISEEKLGKEHPHTAKILHDWGELYKYQGKLDEAEALHNRALEIRQKVLGLKHTDTATSLNSIAELYELQGKADDAEKFYKQSLSIREEMLGHDNPDAAASMYNLAKLYRGQGNVKEAEQLYKRALVIREKRLGLNHSSTIENQRDLADFYKSQQRPAEAERLYKQGLVGRYRKLRPDDPAIKQNLQDLVELYNLLDKSEEIERLYEYAFEQFYSILGINDHTTEEYLQKLLKIYESQDKREKLIQLYKRTFEMRSRKLRGNDRNSLDKFEQNVKDLADIYNDLNEDKEKALLYMEAFRVCSRVLGVDDPLSQHYYDELMKASERPDNSATVEKWLREEFDQAPTDDTPDNVHLYLQRQQNLADFYEKQHKFAQVEQMYEQGLVTSYQKFGLDHPRTIQSRHELAKLYESHGKAGEAERIYRQALEISKRKLEPGSPHIIECTNDLASCYLRHRRSDKAKPLIEETLHICEPMSKEPSFPKEYTSAIVHSLANAATLYQKKYKDKKMRETAELWFERALKIGEEELGKTHQDTVEIRKRYIVLLREMGRYDEAAAVEIGAITKEEADKSNGENVQPLEGDEKEVHEEDL